MSSPGTQRPSLLWAPRAWLPGGWQDQVLLRIGADGCWSEVRPGVAQVPADASVLAGPLLPGLVNAHSHAFQRAFVGLAERRESEADDFWSWRDRMYRVALRVSPAQLRAIAAQLYVELLQGGYTQVCEFHYLQHDRDGQPYAEFTYDTSAKRIIVTIGDPRLHLFETVVREQAIDTDNRQNVHIENITVTNTLSK